VTRSIHIHKSAESDLIGVWRYTFGELQGDEYLDELVSGIRKLADNPESGMRRDFVRDGYRVLFVGSHAVYYGSYHPSLARAHGSGRSFIDLPPESYNSLS
jgi:plasmid stabilization system protein ParE